MNKRLSAPPGSDFLSQLRRLCIHSRHGIRSPHKPLLLLFALGRIQNGDFSPLSFGTVEHKFADLLSEYGPKGARPNVSNPFWRLQTDGDIWTVSSDSPVRTDKSGNPRIADLRQGHASAFFSEKTAAILKDNPRLVAEAAKLLLNAEFPSSVHQEIARATGLKLTITPARNKRSRDFRNNVLRAYSRHCAVCGSQIRLRDRTVGLEAAHIQWHAFNGPDTVNNGLALCPTHHQLFDLGAFSLSTAARPSVIVSREVERSSGAERWLTAFSEKPISLPVQDVDQPSLRFIEWHQSQVFKG